MKTAIITCYSENMQAVADITTKSHADFASNHGYLYAASEVPQEDAVWAKVDMICAYLQTHDVVMWIDADALITNPIKDPTQDYPDAQMILASDVNGLNSGVMIIKASEQTRAFFWAVNNQGRQIFVDCINPEQQAILRFSNIHPYLGIVTYVPQRDFNSYLPGAYNYPGCETAHWRAGDFILHLPGLTNEHRVKILKNRNK